MDSPDFESDLFNFGRPNAADHARRQIATLIDLKRFKPGTRLPAAAILSEELGINRPAVLSALRVLESEGRVSRRDGGRSFFVELNGSALKARKEWVLQHRHAILQMSYLREVVESGIARLVATKGISPRLLRDCKKLMAAWDSTEDRQEMLALDTDFHRFLATASKMPLMADLALIARKWVAPAFDVIAWPDGRKRSSHQEHMEILKAIEEGDGEAAAQAAIRHVRASTVLIESMLRKARPRASSRRDSSLSPRASVTKKRGGSRKRTGK